MDSNNLKDDLKNMKNGRDKIYESIADYIVDVSETTKYKVIESIQMYLNEKNII